VNAKEIPEGHSWEADLEHTEDGFIFWKCSDCGMCLALHQAEKLYSWSGDEWNHYSLPVSEHTPECIAFRMENALG